MTPPRIVLTCTVWFLACVLNTTATSPSAAFLPGGFVQALRCKGKNALDVVFTAKRSFVPALGLSMVATEPSRNGQSSMQKETQPLDRSQKERQTTKSVQNSRNYVDSRPLSWPVRLVESRYNHVCPCLSHLIECHSNWLQLYSRMRSCFEGEGSCVFERPF